MKPIDLQIHTTASDGKFSPSQVVDLAIKKGMKAIAITDHDSVSGVKEALEYSKDKNIEVIQGVEISCTEEEFDKNIHVLGLFIDSKNRELNEFLKLEKNATIKDAVEIIKKAGGISILAHPGRYLNLYGKIIDEFVKLGGEGIEADYRYDKIMLIEKKKSELINTKVRKIAKEKNLLISGGSDFHTFDRGSEIGDAGIEIKEFELLKQECIRKNI